MSPRLRAVLAFLVVYLVWGSTYLGMRIAVQEIPPLLGMGARFVLAGVLLAVAGDCAARRYRRRRSGDR